MIGSDTYATRRHLPHLEKPDRTYFVTFATRRRFILPEAARDVVLECCVHDHEKTCFLHVAMVMPDHVHMILTPLERWRLPQILRRLKGISARYANLVMERRGPLWQDESFDRMLRSDEDLREKAEYICANPVRAGLVSCVDEYKWIWREWIEGREQAQRTGKIACPPLD